MDPRSSRPGLHAPSHGGSELPAVDARLVMPETRYEVEDGRLVYCAPASEPHASRHSKVQAILEAYVREEYDVACDMLTRTSEERDAAPDASVFPLARDPQTGGRQLEQLAFEVLGTQALADAGVKAAKLAARGVRRIFAIDVERQRAFEWSRETGTWAFLAPSDSIVDETLALPLPLEALVRAAKTDDAIARALVAKKNPVIEGIRADGKAEGKAEGKAAALVAVLRGRGLVVTAEAEASIRATRDEAQLDAWLARAATCASVDELLGG